jgi:hypothetical protein
MQDRTDFFKKVLFIQKNLIVQKNKYNAFGKYSYRSAEDILESVKPLLDGLLLTTNDEMVLVGDRIYVKATVTISDGYSSHSATGFAREPAIQKGMSESQITGSSSSYSKKYALNSLFCIDDAQDFDSIQDKEKEILTSNSGDAYSKVNSIKSGNLESLLNEFKQMIFKFGITNPLSFNRFIKKIDLDLTNESDIKEWCDNEEALKETVTNFNSKDIES